MYDPYIAQWQGTAHGHREIDDDLHEEVRRARAVMCRSTNAQAEFWMKIGSWPRPTQPNPALPFNGIVRLQFVAADVHFVDLAAA